MTPQAQRDLLFWYDAEKRDLPWRRTPDPYAIWVSEVMLQQTQIATVLPYYGRWMSRFPTAEALATSDEQEALSLWQGLGYYRRCRMLLAGARFVVENGMPVGVENWLKVPGIGRYTAAAIASISQGEPTPLVDGNVERVFARYTGSKSAGLALHRAAWVWAEASLFKGRPGDWNQALMELGACICKPAEAECTRCPLESSCVAKAKGLQRDLPKRAAKQEVVKLHEVVRIPYYSGSFGVRQIPEGEWWQGMWEFPRARLGAEDPDLGPGVSEHAGVVKYQVTNHKLTMEAYLHHCDFPTAKLRWVSPAELESLPLPAPQRKALTLALRRLEEPTFLPLLKG